MILQIFLVGIACGVFALGCLLAVAAVISSKASRWLSSAVSDIRNAVIRAAGGVPWLPKDVVILSGSHGNHQYCFVSRHHLAEGGLECPLCEERIRAGDFSQVFRTLVDGRENEVIVCRGKRMVNDREVKCETLLIASPDTEHGDHLDDNGQIDAYAQDPPSYLRFVRAPADQWLREKWGCESRPVEAGQTQAGDEIVDVANEPPAAAADPSEAPTAVLPAITSPPSTSTP